MRTLGILLVLASLAAIAAPAAASTDVDACTPYLAFINPNPPHVCVAGVHYDAINDFCVYAAKVNKCVSFVGPVL